MVVSLNIAKQDEEDQYLRIPVQRSFHSMQTFITKNASQGGTESDMYYLRC